MQWLKLGYCLQFHQVVTALTRAGGRWGLTLSQGGSRLGQMLLEQGRGGVSQPVLPRTLNQKAKSSHRSSWKREKKRGRRPEAVSRDTCGQWCEVFVCCGEASAPPTTYKQQPGCLNSTQRGFTSMRAAPDVEITRCPRPVHRYSRSMYNQTSSLHP